MLWAREVWRVLRDDGTFWLNIGDSYYNYRPGGTSQSRQSFAGHNGAIVENSGKRNNKLPFKEKDLMLVPFRLAIALQEPFYAGKIKNELDRVWLAAMLDTEGCLYIHKRKAGQHAGDGYYRKTDTYSAGIEVANTHPQIAEKCLEITGMGSISSQDSGRRQTIYRWHVRSDEAKQILREVYPYMVAKQQQARILYNTESNGKLASEQHQALKLLHSGSETEIDGKQPESLHSPGWYVRSDVIWWKPNPMPESVKDRPTKSHEYIFLLTKNKRYYYDADAIREPNKQTSVQRVKRAVSGNHKNLEETSVPPGMSTHSMHKKRARGEGEHLLNPSGRNKRTVWRITTKPYSGAHFATFPPELPEICIKAGTSEKGCCPECGAQWDRVIDKRKVSYEDSGNRTISDVNNVGATSVFRTGKIRYGETIGWQPTCDHNLDPVPCTVLDCFGGSGTTAMKAKALGRNAIHLDISAEYLELAKERTHIKAFDEWENGVVDDSDISNLPLFQT